MWTHVSFFVIFKLRSFECFSAHLDQCVPHRSSAYNMTFHSNSLGIGLSLLSAQAAHGYQLYLTGRKFVIASLRLWLKIVLVSYCREDAALHSGSGPWPSAQAISSHALWQTSRCYMQPSQNCIIVAVFIPYVPTYLCSRYVYMHLLPWFCPHFAIWLQCWTAWESLN